MRSPVAASALATFGIFCLLIGGSGGNATVAHAEMPFFDFNGFSYLNGSPAQVGTVVTVAAKFNEIQPNPIWPLDLVGNEYTVLVEDLTITSVESYGSFLQITYGGGTIAVYRDPLRNGTWAPNPPNSQVPSSFADGVPELVGHFTEMALFFDDASGTGTVSGLVDWTSGDHFAQLADPAGWTFFGGVSNHAGLGIPEGYDLAWDPQLYGPQIPVPVEIGTWGALKARYNHESRKIRQP